MAPFHWSKIPQKKSPLSLPFTLHLKSPTLIGRGELEQASPSARSWNQDARNLRGIGAFGNAGANEEKI